MEPHRLDAGQPISAGHFQNPARHEAEGERNANLVDRNLVGVGDDRSGQRRNDVDCEKYKQQVLEEGDLRADAGQIDRQQVEIVIRKEKCRQQQQWCYVDDVPQWPENWRKHFEHRPWIKQPNHVFSGAPVHAERVLNTRREIGVSVAGRHIHAGRNWTRRYGYCRRNRTRSVEELGLGFAILDLEGLAHEWRQQGVLRGAFVEQLAICDRAEKLVQFLFADGAIKPILESGLKPGQRVAARQYFKDEELPRIEIVGLALQLVAKQVGLHVTLDNSECLHPPHQVWGQHDLLRFLGHFGASTSVATRACTLAAGVSGVRSFSCSNIHPPPIAL